MTIPIMPLHCDDFAEAVADYLEGDASDGIRSAVESHASSCADCRQLLDDLSRIRAAAAALPALAPSHDLWQGIADRIDARVIPLAAPRVADVRSRRTWLRPAAAAAALVIATAGITHYVTRASLSPATTLAAGSGVVPVVRAADPTAEITSTVTERPAAVPTRRTVSTARLVIAEPLMGEAEPVFASEIGKLRKIVRERRSELDPKTVAVLEQSIAVIDSAIAQSRAALIKDPASGFLASQLNHALEKKVELLRTAAQLPPRI